MKNIVLRIFLVILLINVSCQREKLDTVAGETPSAAYMNNESVKIKITDAGGEAIIEPRLATIAEEDTKVTVSIKDFFKEYNEKNNTEYELLPMDQYELYEKNNPNNKSTNGQLEVIIKKGSHSSPIGVKVNALDPEKFSFGIKYAIPLRITSSSAKHILTEKDAVITFDRPFKTDIVKIKRGYGLGIEFGDDFPECKEFTVQGQFMFLSWASQNQTTIHGFGDYTRVSASGGIQVKDGGGDGDATWTNYPMETGKWYQVTFAYKGLGLKVYINGKLVKTFERSYEGLKPGGRIMLFNTNPSWSANQYVREVRVWARELTDKEINDALYLPVNPKAKDLVAYLPLDSKNEFNEITQYNNRVRFNGGSANKNGGETDYEDFKKGIEWVKNVKFPAEGLEIEE